MKLQETMPLSSIYNREEKFSTDLAKNLEALRIGSFENVEKEAKVGTRRADIVAEGQDGILVVENQFGKADWDHWGRLEAYARLKKATVAVLVAEDFEELMIETCNRCNTDSEIDWYLIRAQANSHKELSFSHVVEPVRESEFWAPIRIGKFGKLFAGKPVPIKNDSSIGKNIRNIEVYLYLNNGECYIRVWFSGKNRSERRNKVMELFPKSDYDYENWDTPVYATLKFPVLNKGKNDRDDWDEIREELVAMGTDIYNKINESDL